MPHSLRAKLSGLRYKKIITDKDYDRLCKALDMEKSIGNIKSEIEQIKEKAEIYYGHQLGYDKISTYNKCLEIIDKHISGKGK